MTDGYCDVSLGDYDGDSAECYQETHRKAAKSHACYECREAIVKGQQYHVVTGKWDGEFTTYRFCESCWEVMGEFSENGKTFGVVWEAFRDEWASGATLQGCLNRLSSMTAKEHMRQQWLKWKGLDKKRGAEPAP